jgi:hypothetical protein
VDFDGLLNIAAQMTEGIEQATTAAGEIRTIITPIPDQAIRIGLDSIHETMSGLAAITWLLQQEDLNDLAVESCEQIAAEAPVEQQVLQQKRVALTNGERPDPDLRPIFKCLLTVTGLAAGGVIAGAGSVATLGIPLATGLGALAYTGGLAAIWDQTRCGDLRKRKVRRFTI